MPKPRSKAPARRTIVLSLLTDFVLVVVFAALGRVSHYGGVLGESGYGLVTTAWPFAVALLIGWGATLAWRAPVHPLRAGVPIWAITVAGGMLLRALSGQGTAMAFVLVATVSLMFMLVGWRIVACQVRRIRR